MRVFRRSTSCVTDEELRRGVALDDDVEVHEADLARRSASRRAACRGSRRRPGRGGRGRAARALAGRYCKGGPAASRCAPVEVGAPQGDADVAAAGNGRAELLLEGLGDAESGGEDSGGCDRRHRRRARRRDCDDSAGPAAPGEVQDGLARRAPAGVPITSVGRSAAELVDDGAAVAG